MADPRLVKIIGVKVPDANLGEYVTVKNLTRGGQLIQPVKGTDRSTVFNPAPNLQWVERDVVHAEIHGRINGYARSTLNYGGTQMTISGLSADTATPGADL